MSEPQTLTLMSWNVNGIRAVWKKGFVEWLLATQPDILGLQESKISADQLTPELLNPPGQYQTHWSHADKRGYSGVSIFTKPAPKSVTEGLGVPEFDSEGRVLCADYGDFLFYTIYYPNGQRDDTRLQYKLAFYDAFLAHAQEKRAEGHRIVVCGDFNTAHFPIDLARPKENETVSGFLPIERAWMDKFVDHGYVDTFRLFEPGPGHYSWWNMRSRARERNVGWRIDYFFVSEDLKDHVVAAGILPDVQGSDHCPVTLTLKFG